MRAKVFVDTSAWKALYDKDDPFHKLTKRTWADFKRKGSLVFTSNFVIDETITLLRVRVDHASAVEFGEAIHASEVIGVIPVDEAFENEAWTIFKRYDDKSFSFTDCTSFAIIRKLKFDLAFTLDHHFRQFGFNSVPSSQEIQKISGKLG